MKKSIPIENPDLTNITFEAASLELEAIVANMEAGKLSLEESILAYERGAALLAHCQATLNSAEQKIQVLNAANQLEDYISRDDWW